eukprot:365744-Chlamydomonas_euryale.AAC.1
MPHHAALPLNPLHSSHAPNQPPPLCLPSSAHLGAAPEFHVTESPRGKVLDTGKISFIKRLLSVDAEASAIAAAASTVFELAGLDCSGLLSNVLQLLVANGCEVTSAAVWTFQNRCALVVGVLDEGQPIVDVPKLQRLQASLKEMLGGEQSVVNHEVRALGGVWVRARACV